MPTRDAFGATQGGIDGIGDGLKKAFLATNEVQMPRSWERTRAAPIRIFNVPAQGDIIAAVVAWIRRPLSALQPVRCASQRGDARDPRGERLWGSSTAGKSAITR